MLQKYKYIIAIVLIVFSTLSVVFFRSLNYYPSETALNVIKSEEIKYNKTSAYHMFESKEGTSDVGYILYPGGFVSPLSYSTFCEEIVKSNNTCVIAIMPLNLAIFGINNAQKIIDDYPNITSWYIGGHSLGGPMVSRFVQSYNGDKIKGIFYLASYTDIDLSNKNINCVSIIGSEDNILDREVYEKSKNNFPNDCKEVVIHGGNHSQFGSYGLQKNDNTSKISNEKQIEDSVLEILNLQ